MDKAPQPQRAPPKQYLHYSTVFHCYQEALLEVSSRVALGFHNLKHREKELRPGTVELFIEFSELSKDKQRELLVNYRYLEALFDVATRLSSDRDLMEYVLPTIDAILCEERFVLKDIKEQIIKGGNRTIEEFMRLLARIWTNKSEEALRPVAVEASLKILSVTYGELPKPLLR